MPRQSEFVFAGSGETSHRINVKRAWKRICKSAAVTGCRVHDLRHTVGSWLSMAGCNLQVVSRVLGHAGTAVTERYSHVNLNPVRTVLEANARAMFALSVDAQAVEVKALPIPEQENAAVAS
jgi:integrase